MRRTLAAHRSRALVRLLHRRRAARTPLLLPGICREAVRSVL